MNATVTVKVESVADIVRDILKADKRLAVRAVQMANEGMFLDAPNEAQKKRRGEYREQLYLQLSKDAGGDAAKAARLTAEQWDDLTGHEKKALQAARTQIKTQVDNRWSRLKKAASTAEEEAKAKEAAESGQPAPAKVYADQIQIWTDYEVRSTKANKRRPEVNAQWLADLQKKYRAEIEAHIAEQKK